MRKLSSLLGMVAGIGSIVLWFVFCLFNPYVESAEVGFILITFTFLFVPACLAIVGSFTRSTKLLLLAFLVSFPLSLYMVGSPSPLALYGVTSLMYLISFILIFSIKKVYRNKNRVA